jgi:hypothetical protein
VGKRCLESGSSEFNDGVIRSPHQDLSIDETLRNARNSVDRDRLWQFFADFHKLDLIHSTKCAEEGINTLNPIVLGHVSRT